MNRKKDVISPETTLKGKRMAVDVSRFPVFRSGKLRVFICDCSYCLSVVGGETACGFRGFRRAEFAIVVMEGWKEFCTRKHKIPVTT